MNASHAAASAHAPIANGAPPGAKDNSLDNSYLIARGLWGHGNLSPLDHLFGTTAIPKLIGNLSLGFIGPHLGRRLHRYSQDTGIWIDTFETDPTLSQMLKTKKTVVKLHKWSDAPELLKRSRYTALITHQPSEVSPTPEIIYRQCGAGLKKSGILFAADIFLADAGGAKTLEPMMDALPLNNSPRTIEEHQGWIDESQMKVTETLDLTEGLASAIMGNIRNSIKVLEELRPLPADIKKQRQRHYLAQLEKWGAMYGLARHRLILATAFMCSKT